MILLIIKGDKKRLNSLSNGLEQRCKSIHKTVKTAFFTSGIVGFISHATILTNRLFNHDSLFAGMKTNPIAGLQQAKWFNVIAAYIARGNSFSAAAAITIGLLLLIMTAMLTVAVLNIKSRLWAACIASFLVLFPSVMSTNTYLSSSTFFFALFLAALAVYFTAKWKHGFWLGILLLTLSCGTYAVFIGYASGLFLILLIQSLLDRKIPVKKTVFLGLKYLAVLLVSALLYYLILQLLLQIYEAPLSSYRSIDSMGQFTVTSLINAVVESYRKVYYFFFYGIHLYRESFSIEPMFRVLNWATLALAAALSVALGIRNGILKSLPRILLTLALAGLFPLAIHAIGVLGQNTYTHWIMIYPFVLVYVYMLTCADRMEQPQQQAQEAAKTHKRAKTGALVGMIAVLIVSALLIRQWFLVTNQGYAFLRYADANAYAQGVLLVDDIREAKGYADDVPVALIGDGAPPAFRYTTGDFDLIADADGTKYTGLKLPVVDTEHVKLLLRNWVGVSLQYADEETVTAYSGKPEVAAMPVYPAEGSIVMADGLLLVKMAEVAPNGEDTP